MSKLDKTKEEISRELYGRDFSQLTTGQKAVVTKRWNGWRGVTGPGTGRRNSSWSHSKAFPLIFRAVEALCAKCGSASREDLRSALLENDEARILINSASDRTGDAPFSIAGNMIDWMSARYSAGDEYLADFIGRFDRRKEGTWTYVPRSARNDPERKSAINEHVLAGTGRSEEQGYS
jgi:hypothetical protein